MSGDNLEFEGYCDIKAFDGGEEYEKEIMVNVEATVDVGHAWSDLPSGYEVETEIKSIKSAETGEEINPDSAAVAKLEEQAYENWERNHG